jgi:hypothetical protein
VFRTSPSPEPERISARPAPEYHSHLVRAALDIAIADRALASMPQDGGMHASLRVLRMARAVDANELRLKLLRPARCPARLLLFGVIDCFALRTSGVTPH